MPFSEAVKTRMFLKCSRMCCLCESHCGTKIEAAHIVDEAKGGSNEEDNGIPVCFDCHAEIGHYNPQHPRGNRYRPQELKARRDAFYQRVGSRASPDTDVAEAPTAAWTAQEEALFQQMDSLTVPVEFCDNTLSDALTFLEVASGIQMVADWPALASVDVLPSATVSLRSAASSLRDTLDRILALATWREATAAWDVDGGSIAIGPPTTLRRRIAVHDVSGVAQSPESVARLIIATVDFPHWIENGGCINSLHVIGSRFVVTARASTHRHIAALLASLCPGRKARSRVPSADWSVPQSNLVRREE